MSVKYICAVKDRAADVFGQPFFVAARQVAVRSFQDAVNNRHEPSDISKHPDDFDLYVLGLFDDASGSLQPAQLELVARGKDLVKE